MPGMSIGFQTATSDTELAHFHSQLQICQQLIIRDIGSWSHFVADASQPMHVSVHFNGWGNYSNPQNYSKAAIHAPFEGSFGCNFVDFNQVAVLVWSDTDRGVATFEQRVPLYLAETLSQLEPVHAATRDSGNDNYQTAQPIEIAIVQKQLAAGASELRDQIVHAWRQSAFITIGFPLVAVSDAEAGIVRITPATFGAD